jgi:hypothetical protein
MFSNSHSPAAAGPLGLVMGPPSATAAQSGRHFQAADVSRLTLLRNDRH